MPVYTPPSQIVNGLYTLGKEWMLGDTNEEYKGPYHTYPNGAAYTLGTFVKGASEWLIPYSANVEATDRIDDPTATQSLNNSQYFKLTGTRFDNYTSPQYYFPQLKQKDYKKILINSKKVLKRAIKKGGSSIRDFKNTSGKKGGFQKNFNVYERKGLTCKRQHCNGIIQKKIITNRSTFFCNICQI